MTEGHVCSTLETRQTSQGMLMDRVYLEEGKSVFYSSADRQTVQGVM